MTIPVIAGQPSSGCPRKSVAILGSTGSIGRQGLDVVDYHPDLLEVTALAAWRSVDLLAEQAWKYRPRLVAVGDPALEDDLRRRLNGLDCRVASGPAGLAECASLTEVDLVLAGMVGFVGIIPVLAAVDAGKQVAIANKEVLVAAGRVVTQRAARSGALLLPVDSEHSAIFQCLQGQQRGQVRRIILTASGGPFSRMDPAALECVTPDEALRHPTWCMGPKITVDCATLMNKGLEVIEARWFFDLPAAQIDIVIHHQSIIHSMVEFSDGAVIAQMGWPTMTLPIQYGLLYPERAPTPTEPLDLGSVATLTFAQPDFGKFPALGLARKALAAARNYPAALSAANEVAVAAFLTREIGFMQIPAIVEHALDRHEPSDESDLDAVLAADSAARQAAQFWIGAHRS